MDGAADRGAATAPGERTWPSTGADHRRTEVHVVVGTGAETWQRTRDDLLHWRVKTRSGFRVEPSAPVRPGARPTITAGALGVRVREPVEVVEVVDGPDRAGFAYRTLAGHPVRGRRPSWCTARATTSC